MQKYPSIMRWLHWGMAILIFGMIASGIYMTGLSKDVSYKYTIYMVHKSIGSLLLFLIIIRFFVRYLMNLPKFENTFSITLRIFSSLWHHLLYALVFSVAFTGYLSSNPYGIKIFNLFSLPVIFSSPNQWTRLCHEIHPILAFTLLGCIALHILATIFHQFDKNPHNRVWHRMKF